jgi:hypothetical protein
VGAVRSKANSRPGAQRDHEKRPSPARQFESIQPIESAANVACCAASGPCIALTSGVLASASRGNAARSVASVLFARRTPVQQLANDAGRKAASGEKSSLPGASGCIGRRLAEAAGPHRLRALQFRLAQTLGIRSIEREAMLGELSADAQVAESLLPHEDPRLDEALVAQILARGKPIEERIDVRSERRRAGALDEAGRFRRIYLRLCF